MGKLLQQLGLTLGLILILLKQKKVAAVSHLKGVKPLGRKRPPSAGVFQRSGLFQHRRATQHDFNRQQLSKYIVDIPRGGILNPVSDGFRWVAADIASSRLKCWIALGFAIFLDAIASSLSKQASDTSSSALFISSVTINFLSMVAYCACLAKIELGLAYAVWSALGMVMVSSAGIVFFRESCNTRKLLSIVFVVIGVVGLSLDEDHD